MDETLYTKRVRDNLAKKCGLPSFKMQALNNRGLPDIYVPRGIWLEQKEVAYVGGLHPIKLMYHLEPAQRQRAQFFHDNGDLSFVSLAVENLNLGKHWIIMRWCHFKCVRAWYDEDIEFLGHAWDGVDMFELNNTFGKQFPGNCSTVYTDELFKSWAAKSSNNIADPDSWKLDKEKAFNFKGRRSLAQRRRRAREEMEHGEE